MKRKTLLFLFVSGLLASASPVFPVDNFDSAEKLFQAGEYKRAIDHLEKVTERDPSNTKAWVLMGDSYRHLGKEKRAIKAYEKAIENDPLQKEALLGMGISYLNLRKHPDAIAVLQHLVEIDPTNAQAHFFLGVSYESIRSIGLAFEEYKILKTLDEKLADQLYHIIFW